MRISCIVPATDSPATLNRCLAAIRAADDPPDEVVTVTEPDSAGPAAARNAGAARTDGELLAFVDADVVVRPDAFTRIRASFEQDPGLVAVFGAYDDEPEAADAVSGFRNLLHHSVHVEGSGPAQSFWAGLGAIRRDAFEQAGGFDAARFSEPSVEDVDLGGRLAAAGCRISLDPAIRGTHLKRWTLGTMVRTDFSRRGVPWTRLVLEKRATAPTLNLGPRGQASAIASLAAAAGVLLRRPRLALAGLLSLVALYHELYELIWRRRGPVQAIVAVPLHLVHQLTASAAAGAGMLAHLRDRATSA